MPVTEKIQVPCYSMKMRLYPSNEQKEKMDRIFRALHVAYNITFHEVFEKNPMVCTAPNDKGDVWPDYKKMAKKEWRAYLIGCNPCVEEAPADSLMTKNGIFLLDAKKAWTTGMNNRPVNAEQRRDFRFYNSNKQRRSFMVQIPTKNIVPSEDNEKVAWIKIPKTGKVKARGFNRKLWFGANGEHTYSEALAVGELADKLTVRISKDTCGDYFASVTISDGEKQDRKIFVETPARENTEPIGIDVGIKDLAVLNTGEKIPNPKFKKNADRKLRTLNRQLSRKWGPSNMAYRDYNKAIRAENRQNPDVPPKPTAVPSKAYLKTQQKKSRLERKIARKRDSYYHQQTAKLVRKSDMIAVETLHVKNMLRNHKLAYALSDVAMSDFISKLKYKAERRNVSIIPIGSFEPSSQLCSVCGEKYTKAKNLSVRTWRCPHCGTLHDRDINAAKNILAIATRNGAAEDLELQKPPNKKTVRRKAERQLVFADEPDIVAVFSKELTTHNNPRYVIINKSSGNVLDDAGGAGYRSLANAKNCYKAKRKWSQNKIQ